MMMMMMMMYLSDIVVGISLEHNGHTLNEESTEALTGRTSQLNVDAVVWKTLLLITPSQKTTSAIITCAKSHIYSKDSRLLYSISIQS